MTRMTEKTAPKANMSFFETLVKWIKLLPADIKILVEMIGDDQLDLKARSLAVGTLVYLITAIDLIPDKIPVLGIVDDVLVLHIALCIILRIDPERAAFYRAKYPARIKALDQEMQLVTDTLGALYSWLTAFVENLIHRRYKGQTTSDAAKSEKTREEIFDDAMVFAAQVGVDEETIRTKLLATPPNRITKLLSDGLEKEQVRQEQTRAKETSGPLLPQGWRVRRLLSGNNREQVEHQEEQAG